MSLTDKTERFLATPFPLWENDLTTDLVTDQWRSFVRYGIWPENYTASKGLYWDRQLPDSSKKLIWGNCIQDGIQLESAEKALDRFYQDSGLEIVGLTNGNTPEIAAKIEGALKMLDTVPGMMDCLSQLVKTIQVIRQDDPEIDTSHTDPEIPFSIFVSVCEDSSPISNLRVAESILHEAMHLKLTLIEKHIDLIVPGTEETSYSPWRDEQRPVRGVLHGLFVFAAVKSFYESLINILDNTSTRKYLKKRISHITEEIAQLNHFRKSSALILRGATLVENLLP